LKQEEAEEQDEPDENGGKDEGKVSELDPDEYGEEVVEIFNSQAKQIKEMRSQIDNLSQAQKSTHEEKATKEFDAFVTEGHIPSFGVTIDRNKLCELD